MEEASAMLGHPYTLCGPVMRGKQLGRKLGIPTINQIIPAGKQFPRNGVYAARVRLEGGVYCGMANVGVKPTIAGERRPGLETHLFEFSGDVYGREAETELLHFIRPEECFARVEDLRIRLAKDRETIEEYFANREKTE
jgi:riboflavin kinase/FMN adenylyltransferase